MLEPGTNQAAGMHWHHWAIPNKIISFEKGLDFSILIEKKIIKSKRDREKECETETMMQPSMWFLILSSKIDNVDNFLFDCFPIINSPSASSTTIYSFKYNVIEVSK